MRGFRYYGTGSQRIHSRHSKPGGPWRLPEDAPIKPVSRRTRCLVALEIGLAILLLTLAEYFIRVSS